ncbi:MAG TPA: Na+/H+ antiporter NhaA, partial [Chitinophagales bacterium]|nr:Na+/H+ antiporter NhaA [Chitinophagales bacterium]
LFSGLQSTHALGIAFGLIFGKPIGILLMCYLAVKLKIAGLPEGVNWKQLAGVGLLAGIGFTMSIFISLLAFEDDQMINISKLAILISSIIAAVTGLWYLSRQMDKQISA